MNRRQLLRGGAVAAAGGVATLAGVRTLADTADAQASADLSITDDEVTLDEDESVAAVELAADVEWAFDVPDGSTPDETVVEIAAAEADTTLETLESERLSTFFLADSGTETFDADLLGAGVLDADALAPDEDGDRVTDVDVEARMRVENTDGDVIASDDSRDTATITVERDTTDADEHGDVGGTGDLTVTVE